MNADEVIIRIIWYVCVSCFCNLIAGRIVLMAALNG